MSHLTLQRRNLNWKKVGKTAKGRNKSNIANNYDWQKISV